MLDSTESLGTRACMNRATTVEQKEKKPDAAIPARSHPIYKQNVPSTVPTKKLKSGSPVNPKSKRADDPSDDEDGEECEEFEGYDSGDHEEDDDDDEEDDGESGCLKRPASLRSSSARPLAMKTAPASAKAKPKAKSGAKKAKAKAAPGKKNVVSSPMKSMKVASPKASPMKASPVKKKSKSTPEKKKSPKKKREEKGSGSEDEETKKVRAARKNAHRLYMKFYRSVNSRILNTYIYNNIGIYIYIVYLFQRGNQKNVQVII